MTTRNYAEQLEEEAYQLARQKLARAAEQTGNEADLDGWLANLDRIHSRRMAVAAEWMPPVMPRPLTATEVLPSAVAQSAVNRVAEAQEEPDNV